MNGPWHGIGSRGHDAGPRPPRRRTRTPLFAVVAVAAIALAACSSGATSPAASNDAAPVATGAAATVVPTSAAPVVTASPAASAASPSVPAPASSGTADARWPLPAAAVLPQATTATLQSLIDGWVGTAGIPGVAAAVVTPDGSWAGAAGVDGSGTPIVADSAFALASITKTFVAAEVLSLAAAGKIDLDAPVTYYVDLPFDADGATVRQLATMTSGFPQFVPDETLQPLVAGDLQRTWTARDIVDASADQPRVGTLGETGRYNGLNYVVLGMVVEKVTGGSLASAIRRDLLSPAGLERIWTQPDEKPGQPQAVAVAPAIADVVDAESGYLPSLAAASTGRGGAGMAADAPSLARWGYLLYGGRVIDPTLVGTMTAGDLAADNGYGFGTMTAEIYGATVVGHAGDYMGYSSMLLVWPETRTAVAVLAPKQGVSVDGTLPGWVVSLYQALAVGPG